MIEVLLAHRSLPADALIAAMDNAVDPGMVDPHVVVIDGRRAAGAHVAPVIPIGVGPL